MAVAIQPRGDETADEVGARRLAASIDASSIPARAKRRRRRRFANADRESGRRETVRIRWPPGRSTRAISAKETAVRRAGRRDRRSRLDRAGRPASPTLKATRPSGSRPTLALASRTSASERIDAADPRRRELAGEKSAASPSPQPIDQGALGHGHVQDRSGERESVAEQRSRPMIASAETRNRGVDRLGFRADEQRRGPDRR